MRCSKPRLGRLVCLFVVCLALVAAGAASAANPKVKVCHVPPGNPANFHTITISANALPAHLAHGDLPGSCYANCESLCSDGDPCTIDACDPASEQCLNDHPPVSCSDGNLCTIDTCSAEAGGCVYEPVTCVDADNCTVDACDPLTGSCVAPPIECPEGESCDPASGDCVADDPCTPDPCLNGFCSPEGGGCLSSICTPPPGGGFVCNCDPGWTGIYCEIDIDECASNPCVHGDCTDLVNAYSCSCLPGWTGTNCDTETPQAYDCETNNPCTPENAAMGLFYFPAADPATFLQCSEFGQCYVLPCPPGLVWSQPLLTCVSP